EIKPPPVQPGMPSELLLRRPDVAEAEASLASAHGNVDAARAAFFPSIGLSGSGGFASSALGSLFNGTTLFYSIGASVLQTIFDGGLKASQSDLAKAQQLETIANYRSSVLNAFTDVESSLGTVSALAEQQHYLGVEVDNAREALRISEIQYREGVADLLAVLQAQQTLFSAQDQLVQTRLARLQSNVSLYQEVGVVHRHDDGAFTHGLRSESPPAALSRVDLPARGVIYLTQQKDAISKVGQADAEFQEIGDAVSRAEMLSLLDEQD